MEKKQIEVLQWWYGDRDYNTGAMLFSKYGRNTVLKTTLMKPGKEKYMSGKLHYELCKAVGLNIKNMPLLPEEAENLTPPLSGGILKIKYANVSDIEPLPSQKEADELPDAPYAPEKYVPIISDVKALQYPKVIRRLTMEYQENYQERSILHKQMRSIDKKNTQGNMQDRAILLKQIQERSERLSYLYAFMKRYEKNKVVPLEEEIWPPKPETDLPDDINELKKLKKNLQTNNTKDNNLLQFQQKTKRDKENPMPEGPKRKRIELRIKKRDEEILVIDNKLVELENAT